jgi:hypothetical protein
MHLQHGEVEDLATVLRKNPYRLYPKYALARKHEYVPGRVH